MTLLVRYVLLLSALLFSATALSQDISGNYTLDVVQNPGAQDCVWSGNLNLAQSGGNPGSFSGSANVNIVSGPCPNIGGAVSGTINGTTLSIGVAVSGLGNATFTGNVVGGGNLSGTWSGLGVTGTWLALPIVAPPPAPVATAVPVLPLWGLLLLPLFIVGLAARMGFKRRV